MSRPKRKNKADVIEVLRELTTLKRRNPTIGGTCVYTGMSGRHCIAGEALVRLGLGDRVPTLDQRDINMEALGNLPLSGVLTPAALRLLSYAQREADAGSVRWDRIKMVWMFDA